MKKETLKEIGKYFFDICKILLAIAVITPFAKNEPFPIAVIPCNNSFVDNWNISN